MEAEQLNFGRRLAYVDRTDRTPGEPCAGKKKTGGGISDKQKGCRRGQGAGRSIEAGGLREPFVLLVAVKLLLPGRMTELDRTLSAALNRNMDVKAVFAAVGELFTREGGAASAAEEVYRAVFQPEVGEADKTSRTARIRRWR